jgi:hypothetical protein
MKHHTFYYFLLFSALTLLTCNANAEVLVAKTRTSPIVFGGSTYSIDFNGAAAGGTQYGFSTSGSSTKVVFMFNAECVAGGDAYHWADVDILVDPAGPVGEYKVKPSNGDNAFCSGNNTPSNILYDSGDGWVSASIIGVATLPAGVHHVRVRVNGAHANLIRLDDMSLVVIR